MCVCVRVCYALRHFVNKLRIISYLRICFRTLKLFANKLAHTCMGVRVLVFCMISMSCKCPAYGRIAWKIERQHIDGKIL